MISRALTISILSMSFFGASMVAIAACSRQAREVASSTPSRAHVFGRHLQQLPRVDDPDVVDAKLMASAATIIDASLLDNMSRLTSENLQVGDALIARELLLLTFRLDGDPPKGQWHMGGILLQDWSHQIAKGGYEFYKPRAVYRIYLQGTTFENSEWVAVRLLRERL